MIQTPEEKISIAEKVKQSLEKSKAIGEKMKAGAEVSEAVVEMGKAAEAIEPAIKTEAPEIKPAIETKTEKAVTEVKKTISLFDDLNKKTEEDLNRAKEPVNKIEKAVERLSGGDEITEAEVFDDTDPKIRKELADVKAAGIVELSDLVFMLICMVISGSWDKTAQEKYTLTDKRKGVLKILIMKVILTNKAKKINPVGSIVLVVVTSAIPMIILAIWERVSKKREAEKRDGQISELNEKIYQLNELKTEISILQNKKQPEIISPQVIPAKKKEPEAAPVNTGNEKYLINGRTAKAKGRHKNGCMYHTNNKYCNCGKY